MPDGQGAKAAARNPRAVDGFAREDGRLSTAGQHFALMILP